MAKATLFALLALALSAASAVHAGRAERVLNSSPTCLTECPAASSCDFVFQSSGTPSNPTFNLTQNVAAGSAEYKLGTNPNIPNQIFPCSKNGYPNNNWNSVILNAGNVQVLNKINGTCDARSQFYLGPNNGPKPYVVARTFQPPYPVSSFAPNCYKVTIKSATLTTKNGQVVNLNPNDGNSVFPESKRCVIFKTSK